MNLVVPEAVQWVLATLRRAGHPAYLVGGCVRDLLLGVVPKDWDVATSAPPEAVMGLFPRVVPTGVRFGTVTVLTGDKAVEVTTFRREGRYRDGRRPETVTLGATLAEDLTRRDFTVNAMAWSPEDGLVDPHGGQADLQARLIRAVGDPHARFAEDALRLLRAVRLAATLGFAVEPSTWQALCAAAPRIGAVARERVREELSRILLSERPALGMRLLAKSGLLHHVLPELCTGYAPAGWGVSATPGSRHSATTGGCELAALDRLPPALHLRLAALFLSLAAQGTPPGSGPPQAGAEGLPGGAGALTAAQVAQDTLRRLRYDRVTVERVAHLVRHHPVPLTPLTERDRRRWVAQVGIAHVADLLTLCRATLGDVAPPAAQAALDALARTAEAMAATGLADPTRALAIDGHDVMAALGTGPGPMVGQVLARLRQAIIDDPALNHRAALLALARRLAAGTAPEEAGNTAQEEPAGRAAVQSTGTAPGEATGTAREEPSCHPLSGSLTQQARKEPAP